MRNERRSGISAGALASAILALASGGLHAQSQVEGALRQDVFLRVTADDVVALALENNLLLERDRFGPKIADVDVRATETAWTPELSARVGRLGSHVPSSTVFDASQASVLDRQTVSETAWAQRLSWGTSYRLSWNGGTHASSSGFARFDPELQAGATAAVVQPLLKGLRFDDDRAAYQSGVQNRRVADAALTSSTAITKAQALHAYWTWVYARDVLSVQRESLGLAQTLLDGNRARVAAGAMAAVDVIEAEAEVARRSEAIVIAEKNVANAEDLVRMLAFDPKDPRSNARLEPSIVEPAPADTASAVERALASRQDLAALRASIAIEDIATRRARNDLLPDASLRADYALRGVGGTEVLRGQTPGAPITGTLDRSFGGALDDLGRLRYPAWSIELAVSYPIGQTRAETDAARAGLRKRQAEVALRAAEQRVAMEVRAAAREVTASSRRLELTATAVALSERRLEAEQRKFAVGLSTSFFVFQAQRDLSDAREAALRSILDYRLSRADIDTVQITPIERR